MSNYKEIKKALQITDAEVAEAFGYKSKVAFANSSAKKRIEAGLEWMYAQCDRKP